MIGLPIAMWPDSLRFLDVTRSTLEANLAVDLELLSAVETDASQAALRVWEWPQYAVIVGRSNDLATEVHTDVCETEGVPILRRSSGGGAVVLGPGCLCYSLALPVPDEFANLGIAGVTRAVMQRLAEGLSDQQTNVTVKGISDLAMADRKIAGNAQRWRSRAFLHHGTLLYDFDLARIERYLKHPSREPDYRGRRSHAEFVTNLGFSREKLIARLRHAWNAVDL